MVLLLQRDFLGEKSKKYSDINKYRDNIIGCITITINGNLALSKIAEIQHILHSTQADVSISPEIYQKKLIRNDLLIVILGL